MDKVLEIMADYGLTRDKLDIFVMAEIPANTILVDDFAKRFDGFSIGSNDLTQLTLGVDRDNGKLSAMFSENNPAVKKTIEKFLWDAHERGKKVGICGEAPATTEGFVEFLVNCGIDTISVNPEAIIKTYQEIEKHE
jgi:pyruvate,water dikinase